MSLEYPGRRLWLVATKWLGLTLCVALFAAWTYSTRSAATYTTADIRHQWGLMLGAVGYAWRPEGWSIEQEKYPSRPGLEYGGEYGGSPGLYWWPEVSWLKTWHGVMIPIWMPFAVIGVTSSLMWWRDRRATRRWWSRVFIRLRPATRKRVTVGLVLVFIAVHVAALATALFCYVQARTFFERNPRPLSGEVLAIRILGFGAPLFGVLLASVWTRFRNRLFDRQPGAHCRECGYDLTGNTSGRCPECGGAIPVTGSC